MGLVVTNSTFRLPPSRLPIGKLQQDAAENDILRSQTNFVLLSQMYQNSVDTVNSYPGVEVDSNHDPFSQFATSN